MQFSKMQSLGNDFVVFETLTQTVSITPTWIKQLADRHFGIGCDQVLVIGKSEHPQADFDYTIYNQDGSVAKQCGNGARCVGLFIQQNQLSPKNKITLATFDHLTHIDLSDLPQISVDIGVPVFDQEKSEQLHLGVLSVGNPHLIIQVPDVSEAEVDKLGQRYNAHPLFPEGVNVSFCQVLSKTAIKLRVFERGAAETLACGSAACAASAYLRQLDLVNETLTVHLPGGDLQVHWQGMPNPIRLRGDAHTVFTGIYR